MATPEYIFPPRRKPGPKSKAEKAAIAEEAARETVYADDALTLSYFLHAPDVVLRTRYSQTLNKDEALRELARLRKIAEIAATEINQRMVPDEQTCLICKRELPTGFKVTMMANLKDDATGIITTHPICSVNCVKEYNKFRMGLSELVK